MDTDLFLDILKIDSTSRNERQLAEFLFDRLRREGCDIKRIPADVADGEPVNLMISWGVPRIVYCTHLDTVPPYIPPVMERDGDAFTIKGRGACDAKGQIFSMLTACLELAREGAADFGLLLLYGEETGSYGAKAMKDYPGAEYVVVGEPTDNRMVSASKGTKAFEVEIEGTPFHSGYPQYGHSAIERFVDLMERLRRVDWPVDAELGDTTYNVGKLVSDNPQNILSPHLSCRIYFRTTFASDAMVQETMQGLASETVTIRPLGGDTPSRYLTLPGFETTTVAFGSDAPQLHNFKHKMLCGPGTILVAHTPREFITSADLEQAVRNYKAIYHTLNDK